MNISNITEADSPDRTGVIQKGTQVKSNLLIPLLVIATAQLMLVLDDSISNIALPSIQSDLGISAANLPWVINSYILFFGGLLLFGGRLGDLYGRRRIFQLGVGLFTLASLLSGLAVNGVFLIGARCLQGIGAALAAPNALALIATTFPLGKTRNKALAIYGAMSGLGIVVGLLLGGVLTETLGWRWVYFITVPIGALVLAGTKHLVDAERHPGRMDILGALTSTGGMGALVYAFTRGGEHGWTNAITLGLFATSVLLLAVFLVTQARSKIPLLPLGLFKNRNRTGSYLGMLLLSSGPMGTFFVVTLYMQLILRFSPLQTGLSWLPFAVGIMVSAGIASKLVSRIIPRYLIVAGMLICAGGALWLSNLDHNSTYFVHIMPGIFATAFGFGMAFVPLTLTGVTDVPSHESGIASALLNSAQQIGTALGLSILSTVAVSVTEQRVPNALKMLHEAQATGNQGLMATATEALAQGYSTALVAGSIILLTAAILSAFTINTRQLQTEGTGMPVI